MRYTQNFTFLGLSAFLMLALLFSLPGCSTASEETEAMNFSIPVLLSGTDQSSDPDIAVDAAGTMHIAFSRYLSEQSDIQCIRSIDRGSSWSSPGNITSTAIVSEFRPVLAADGFGNLCTVWYNNQYNALDICFSRSTDSAFNWRIPVNVSNNSGASSYPHLTTNSTGHIFAVWIDETPGNMDIFFSRSLNNGSTWTTPKNLSNNSGESRFPRIACDGSGNLGIVWGDNTYTSDGLSDIYFKHSSDNGSTWSPAINISSLPGINDWLPSMKADSWGNIQVIWQHGVSGNSKILFSRSSDNGMTWSQPLEISDSQNAWWPEIDVDDSGNINTVWSDGPQNNRTIKFRRSTDGGDTWGNIINVSNGAGGNESPAITSDATGKIFLVWRGLSGGTSYLYFCCSESL